jgi:protein SCO1
MRTHSQHGLADKALFLIIFAVAIAAGLGLWLGQRLFANKPPAMHNAPREYASMLVYPTPKAIAPFALQMTDGSAFNVDALKGRYTLLSFGFTTCPDICPTTLTGLKQVNTAVPEALRPRIMLVSIDPERDTPAKLAEYLQFFDPSFVGATGDIGSLTSFAANLGAVFEKEPAEPGQAADAYMMAHTTSLFLIGPDGHLLAMIRQPFEWRQISRDLSVFLARSTRAGAATP